MALREKLEQLIEWKLTLSLIAYYTMGWRFLSWVEKMDFGKFKSFFIKLFLKAEVKKIEDWEEKEVKKMADETVSYSFGNWLKLALGAGAAAALVAGGAAFGNGKLDSGDIYSIVAAFLAAVGAFVAKNPFKS